MGFFDIVWDPAQPDDRRSGLWRLNIAAEHQGRGYGRFAVQAVRDEAHRRGHDRVYTTWKPGPDGPKEQFYLKLGFRLTGEPARTRWWASPLPPTDRTPPTTRTE